jgi:acetyl esterase/lipase
MMQWFWDNYTTNPAERAQIHASPLNASAEQLKGLPAALVQTAEFDVCVTKAKATPGTSTRPACR